MVAANFELPLRYRVASPVVLPGRMTHGLDYPPPLTAEDIRIHAWIYERLAVLHRERNSLWAKMRRFLFGNRQVAE